MAFFVQRIEMGVRRALFVRDAIDRDEAFAYLVTQGLDQIRVRSPAGHNPLDRYARLKPLAQNNGRVWQIRARDDDIRLCV